MNATPLAGRLERVREEIAGVQAAHGLRQDVRIVAVTKGHDGDAVRAAHGAGLVDVGENRVQEALGKRERLGDVPVRWHLIGHLQTNKAKLVPGAFALVHSVDSTRVADALAGAVRAVRGERLPVLLQVNVAGEEQKSGCDPAEAAGIANHVAGLTELTLEGLMTMAPFTDDEAMQRRAFAGLRGLRDRLATAAAPLRELSMGMSGDYRAAVAEGSTMLRLGTVLFGERSA